MIAINAVWEAAVQARHAVPDPGPYPHAGETRFGPTYTAFLGGSTGSGGNDSKMGDHNFYQMLAPANWVTPHWDHHGFQVSTNLDGTGTMALAAFGSSLDIRVHFG